MAGRPRLVLASGSPRRARALETLGLSFAVDPPDVDENPLPGEQPEALVERLAAAKVGHAEPGTVRLAVDTIVVLDHEVVGKPSDATDAMAGLLRLGGRTHDVVSGWAITTPDGRVVSTTLTTVAMREISRYEAAAYVATGEPMDKAGSYAIQGFGARFVESIEGSIGNVMGFPAEDIVPRLRDAGIEVRHPGAPLIALRAR